MAKTAMKRALLQTAAGVVLAGCANVPPAQPSSPPAHPARPPNSQSPAVLKRGDVVDLDGVNGSFSTQIATPSGSERFVVMLASARLDGSDASFRYRMLLPAQGALRPVRGVHCSVTRDRLQARANPQHSQPTAIDAEPAPLPAPVVVGDKRTFLWGDEGTSRNIHARAVLVGDRTVVWADESPHHATDLDSAFVAEFQKDFETLILPRARAIFGHESDIDHDGRIALLFSPMTRKNATVAFFRGCDLAPRRECASSNEAEILYLTPPNAIAPPYNTPRAIKEILAHELEHLLHHNRKVVRNHLPENPDGAYLLEGFGALAQDVLGFQSGNLYVAKAGLDDVDLFSLGAVVAENAEYDQGRDGALRGGAYLFVRWLYDQAGGDRLGEGGAVLDAGGPALVRALLDSPRSVASEIASAFGAQLPDIAMDFYSALAMSNQGLSAEPCFAYLPTSKDVLTGRQRGTDVFASFHGMQMSGVRIRPAGEADGVLMAGGVEYLKLDAGAGRPMLSFTVTADPAAQPRVRVIRME